MQLWKLLTCLTFIFVSHLWAINLFGRNGLAMDCVEFIAPLWWKKFVANYAIISSLRKVLRTCEEFLIEFAVCIVRFVSLTCVLGQSGNADVSVLNFELNHES